jgi:hypothetical protein
LNNNHNVLSIVRSQINKNLAILVLTQLLKYRSQQLVLVVLVVVGDGCLTKYEPKWGVGDYLEVGDYVGG